MYPSVYHNRTVGLPAFVNPKYELCDAREFAMVRQHIEETQLETGVVSEGTLRNQDLIPRFMDAVRAHAPDHYTGMVAQAFGPVPAHAMEDDDDWWWESEQAAWLLDDLITILEDHAPEGTYFGVHDGDGACWGFWALDMED